MPAKTELDTTDRRIMKILSEDGRASYQAMADEIGLSRPAIMERVKRLEEAGYIRGYRVQLDRAKVGLPVTAFTRVVDRREAGGPLYVQYWFYYPESFTGAIGRLFGDSWPGFHPDDWEGYQVRVAPGGAVSARATAHGGYGAGWGAWTGWYKVLGGSHAGQLARRAAGERTTPASKLALVPLERLRGPGRYSFQVSPPWRKDVYRVPESPGS